MTDSTKRPSFVCNLSKVPSVVGRYPGESERLSHGQALAKSVGLKRLGIHIERLPPGARTSWPHAEETEEEFVMVNHGEPELWLDGVLHPLSPGDIVGFCPGTGIAHTFINNSESDCELLVVGEKRDDNRVFYPLNPEGHSELQDGRIWKSPPKRALGQHDGLSDLERRRRQQMKEED